MDATSSVPVSLRSQLVKVAVAFAGAKRLSLATVSSKVLNGGHRLEELAKETSDITTSKFEDAMRWFSANWPEGFDWPAEITRPEQKADEPKPVEAA